MDIGGSMIKSVKNLTNLNEYFFGEDQGRYLVEISKSNLKKIQIFLKQNNIFFDVVAEVQNDTFEVEKIFNFKTKELHNCNNQWYTQFNAIN